MKKIIPIIFMLIGISSYSQKLTCADFQCGELRVIISEPFRMDWKILREEDYQIDTIDVVPEDAKKKGFVGGKKRGQMNWIDECNYRITYKNEYQSPEFKDPTIEILIELVEIKGKCFYYKSTLELKGMSEITYGALCKE